MRKNFDVYRRKKLKLPRDVVGEFVQSSLFVEDFARKQKVTP